MKSKRKYASQWKQDRHTIDCSFLIAEYRSQRLRFVCSKVLEENEIVVYVDVRNIASKIAVRRTLIIITNPRQVNSLLHPDTFEHVLGADSGTLQNSRRTKCSC